jgi:hypothetical protein
MDDMSIGMVKVDRDGLAKRLRKEATKAVKRFMADASKPEGIKHSDGSKADVTVENGRFNIGPEELGKLLSAALNQGFDLGFGMALKVVEQIQIMDGPPKDDEKKHEDAKSPLGFEVPGSKAVH